MKSRHWQVCKAFQSFFKNQFFRLSTTVSELIHQIIIVFMFVSVSLVLDWDSTWWRCHFVTLLYHFELAIVPSGSWSVSSLLIWSHTKIYNIDDLESVCIHFTCENFVYLNNLLFATKWIKCTNMLQVKLNLQVNSFPNQVNFFQSDQLVST